VLSGGTKSFSFEYPCHSPTEQLWFHLWLYLLSEDRELGVVTMHLDISNRKHAETAHQTLTERLSLATAVAKVVVWEWNLSNNCLTWDFTMFDIYGIPSVIPMTYEKWASAVHSDDLPAVEATLRRLIDQKSQNRPNFALSQRGAPRGTYQPLRECSSMEVGMSVE
jgi:PAS domain-containing protein